MKNWIWSILCFCYNSSMQLNLQARKKIRLLKEITSLDAAFFPFASPCSLTCLRAEGMTFQNSLTNSLPFRLLFCKMSLAKYRKATCCSFWADLNDLCHIPTICLAFFLCDIHKWDSADLGLRKSIIGLTRISP